MNEWQLKVVHAATEGRAPAEPTWDPDGAPHCSEHCRYFDGKRCELLGARPSYLCEPVTNAMAAQLDAADRELAAEREKVGKLVAWGRKCLSIDDDVASQLRAELAAIVGGGEGKP